MVSRALFLVVATLPVIPACSSSNDCTSQTPTSVGVARLDCNVQNAGTTLTITSADCSVLSPRSCSFELNGDRLHLTVASEICKSDGTNSTGCGDVQVVCTGPVLREGTYTITNASSTTTSGSPAAVGLVVTPGLCRMQ